MLGTEACRGVYARFLNAVDRGVAASVIDCFTDDATLTARGQTYAGRAEIAAFLAGRDEAFAGGRRSAHLITNG